MSKFPNKVINGLVKKIQMLTDKYEVTYSEIAAELTDSENLLATLIDGLSGNAFDMKGLSEFQSLLRGV